MSLVIYCLHLLGIHSKSYLVTLQSLSFPPTLWDHLAEMFNNSRSDYLICFHPPRIIIERYGFDVDLITQTPTSMHGSSEGHTGYLYKRQNLTTSPSGKVSCDPLYHDAYELVKSGPELLYNNVVTRVDKELYSGRVTRAKKMVHCVGSDEEEGE